MQPSAAHVQIFAIAAIENKKGRDVCQQAGNGNDKHCTAKNLYRSCEASDRLEDNPACDNEKRAPVDESHQHLKPFVAVSALGVGGPFPEP